ncbi:MAG: hypothetical protein ACYDEV_03820 [Acidiferrobacter sp.]
MRIGSDKDVAAILGISTVRLKARISAGLPTPPFMKVPWVKRRRWDLDGVETWMVAFTIDVTTDAVSIATLVGAAKKRGRGRPRKTAQKIS